MKKVKIKGEKMTRAFFACFLMLFVSIIYGNEHSNYDFFLENIVKNNRIPGLTVAVFNNDEIVYSFAHGISKNKVSVTIDTPFFIGSTTKTLTALSIMKLDYEGRLDINDPVISYLPNFFFNNSSISPDAKNVITIRHLLNHTSGISNKGIQGIGLGEQTLDDEIKILNNSKLIYPPEEKYEYCNLNYRLLGLIIEKVSGKKYGTFLKENIFTPLSMNNSFSNPQNAVNLIEGYGQLYGFPINRKQNFYPGALPSGYLISSAADISILLMDIINAFNGNQNTFSQKLIEETLTTPEEISSEYAMGWLKIDREDNTYFFIHGGSLENYQSFFYIDPVSNKGFVFMMNQGGFFPMINSFNNIRDGLIKLINGDEYNYTVNNSLNIIVIIFTLIIILFQCLLFFLLRFWKRNVLKGRIWTNVSMFLNVFWVIFLSFIAIPLMNVIMGDTASLSMIANMFPELIIIGLIIVISNITRLIMKIMYLYKTSATSHNKR